MTPVRKAMWVSGETGGLQAQAPAPGQLSPGPALQWAGGLMPWPCSMVGAASPGPTSLLHHLQAQQPEWVQHLLETRAGQGHPPLHAAVQDAVLGHFFCPHPGRWHLWLHWGGHEARVDITDPIDLSLVMSLNAGMGEYKITAAALGWTTPELTVSCWNALWVGALGFEFDWHVPRGETIPTSVWSITSVRLPRSGWSHTMTWAIVFSQQYYYWCSHLQRPSSTSVPWAGGQGGHCCPERWRQGCWPSAPCPLCHCCQHARLGVVYQALAYPSPASRFQ